MTIDETVRYLKAHGVKCKDVINGISKAAEAWNRREENESRTDKERNEARQRESL